MRRSPNLTEANIAYIRSRLEAGHSISAIARSMGRDRSGLSQACQRHGLVRTKGPKLPRPEHFRPQQPRPG